MEEGFEEDLGDWTFTSMNTANDFTGAYYPAGITNSAAHSGDYSFRLSSYNRKGTDETYDQYLVSPELTTTGNLKFYANRYGANDHLYVGTSTTTADLDAFTWGEDLAFASNNTWFEFTQELPEDVKYVAFHYYGDYAFYIYLDDITISTEVPAGEWVDAGTTTTNSMTLNLEYGKAYDARVMAECSDYSEPINFTTLVLRHFVTEGEWNVAANWSPEGLPEEGADVIIDAPATIPGNYLANVGHVALGTDGAITIADGGQLRHTNVNTDGVTVTLEKVINAYPDMNVKSGYYFIAPAPFIQTISPNSVENLKSNEYDFYSFNAAAEDGLEWRNLHDSNTSLKSAHGYLYANSETVTLKSTGLALSATSGGASLDIQYNPNDGYEFNGWELAGNPYVCNGYVYVESSNHNIIETDFYRMNEDGDGYDMISSTDPLKPFEGVLVYIEGNQGQRDIRFSPDPVESSNGSKLNMNLSRNGRRIDMARVRFGEGQNLAKKSFRENSSKLFIPQNGKDYAMVYSEAMGTMPVNFKAEENGSYTLSFNAEEVSFAYLHLIDNMTGIETDLLANPNYSFEAKTTDYESRFKLVFATGNNANDDAFAFFSNGSFVINNEGEATLQVIDINGRILKSESINGCANVNVNAAAGVYVLRLVNGNDVKVQKVVVR
jgi:hypothetical protein